MSLNKKQFRFSISVAILIIYMYIKGYTVSFADAYAKTGHRENSFHYKRLAIDLNLFHNGNHLTKTSDHQMFGEFWELLGGSWGGRWNDGTHYSWGESRRAFGKQSPEQIRLAKRLALLIKLLIA